MHILIAPNAFKNSLDARKAAEAIAEGFAQSRLECTCQLFPVADGGDGTGELVIQHLKGEEVIVDAQDALGRWIKAHLGLLDSGKTAVIEMANAAGIRLLKPDELNPMQANSAGTGQMILEALNRGVNKIIIGMGGSATVDAGVGILSALGAKFLDEAGTVLKPVPGELESLARVDTSGLDERILNCEVIVLCDVDNRLLGDNGAAAVFGPQKGASPEDVVVLDAFLENLSRIALKQIGRDMAGTKHSGTAGGAAAGLYAFINAQLVNGADTFLNLTNFERSLHQADLLITAEGSIDEQTLQGKAPAAVAGRAKKQGLPVIGLAGNIPQGNSEALSQYFDQLININPEPVDINIALANTYHDLVNAARMLGDELAGHQKDT